MEEEKEMCEYHRKCKYFKKENNPCNNNLCSDYCGLYREFQKEVKNGQ